MKRNQFLMVLMAVVAAMFASCGSSDGPWIKVDYVPVQIEEDGKWGMVGPDGELLYDDEFTNEPTLVVNGLFSVREGEHYAVYAAEKKKPRLIPGCDDLKGVGVYGDGVIPVTRPKSRITLINGDGKTIATLNPIGGKEIVRSATLMSENLLSVQTEDNLWGFVNKEGNTIVEPKYNNAWTFSDGVAMVTRMIKDELVVSIIDTKGKEVARLKKGLTPTSYFFVDGRMACENQDGRCGFIDKKGEFTKVSGKVSRIGEYNSKYFAYMDKDGNWGVMSFDGEETVIRAKYGSVDFRSDGTFLVKDGDDYMVLDANGDKQIEITDYTFITMPYPGCGMIGRDGSRYIFLDADGKPLNKEEFASFGTHYSESDYVDSDYFNTDAVAQAIVSLVSKNGIGQYHLGETASKLGLNPDDYRWSYSFENDSIAPKGWRYRGNVRVNMSEIIAVGSYNSFYDYVFALNPSSKISNIDLSVYCAVECWSEIKPILINGLKAKGFRIKDEKTDILDFTGAESDLSIQAHGNGKLIIVSLMKSDANSLSSTINAEVDRGEVLEEVAVELQTVCDTVGAGIVEYI